MNNELQSNRFANLKQLAPGMLLALIVMVLGYAVSWLVGELLPFETNPISPLLMTILLGLVIRNTVVIPSSFLSGINFCIKKVLRFGIILMGIKISIIEIARIGLTALGIVIVCIVSALVIVHFLTKLLKVEPRLGTLIAAGTSICGVSAIVAASPSIGASEDETAYAVATITLFGLLATILYPYLVELVFRFDVIQAGFFLGTSIHDTSQVTAAGLIYDSLWSHLSAEGLSGGQIAITTKLVRNTFMIAVIPILGFLHNRGKDDAKKSVSITSALPLFVLGYLAMGLIRTTGDALLPNAQWWVALHKNIATLSSYAIAIAIAGIGLNTNMKRLVKLGYKPFFIGLGAACALGGISFLLVTGLHGHLLV